ncbi:MAG: methyltransferase [Oligoflexus sp.]|nr:methyltransferase [Oligoflexus sp.]
MSLALDERYREIIGFLKPFESLWLGSILPRWPESRTSFPEAWLSFLGSQSFEDQRAFEDERPIPGMPEDLALLLERAGRVCELESVDEAWSLADIDVQGLNLKKQHEISRLLPLLASEGKEIERAVDIGGGMGHLARLCVKNFAWDFHSIDRDPALQDKGRWWLNRSRGLDKAKLSFVNAEFSEQADPRVDALFNGEKSLSLGLHTCGGLALSQFRKSLASSLIVNFGCCYDKMNLSEDVNRSALALELNLPWSQSSLFLATRSRKGLSVAEFALMKRVNEYRFAIDLLFRKLYPHLGFVVAGDASKVLYAGDFSRYVIDRFARCKLELSLTADELNAYFASDVIQKEIAAIFAAHMLQNLFARPLELAILHDRALWLSEQNYSVRLVQVFDREQSPRNVAIVAHLTNARIS